MPKLVLKFKDKILQEIALNKPCITIGRTGENDIVINNLGVSRLHAQVIQEGEDFFLEDMGSRNGTTLNNQELKSHKYKLDDKDEITIAKHIIHFFRNEDVSGDNATPKAETRTASSRYRSLSPEETVQISPLPNAKDVVTHKIPKPGTPVIAQHGVEIIEGDQQQKLVNFERVLIVGGKGPTVDIRIKGEYDKDVALVISKRPTGFFISPPKAHIVLKVNGQDVKDYVQLQNGDIIDAAETKMKFFSHQ